MLTAMWFTTYDGQEVEIPDALISSHAEGQLVLFVGAGASVDSPSELPTFKELTEQLYKKAKSAYLKIKQRLTRFLAN